MVWPKWARVDEVELAAFVSPETGRYLPLDLHRFDVAGEPDERRRIAEAIYDGLLARNIRYSLEKFDPSQAEQIIRTPREVLEAPREGTCLDLAVLFAGLCLSFELLPLLVVVEGHALAAVSLTHGLPQFDGYRRERAWFEDGPLKEVARLRELVDEGAYIAVECTGFAHSERLGAAPVADAPETAGREDGVMTFERALAAGRAQLDEPGGRLLRFALDVAVAHHCWKIRPHAIEEPSPATVRPPTNLDRALDRLRHESAFVGDEERYRKPIEHLEVESCITLHGSPGRGKTRLGRKIAEVVLGDTPEAFPDGVWVVELGRVETRKLFLRAVADALDLTVGGPVTLKTLSEGIGDRRLLLILDRCEHLHDDVRSLVSELLPGCSKIRILATSQQASDRGRTFKVPLLSVPPADHSPMTADGIRSFEAVQFLVQQVEYHGGSLEITDENAAAVASLCRELDGVPLELDLAAAHVPRRGLADVEAELRDRFALLSRARGGLDGEVSPEGESLLATINWSYRLLKPAERKLLAALSVFAGSWTRDAALTVCGESITGKKLQKLLDALVGHSFVESEGSAGGECRFSLLRSVRAFAERELPRAAARDVWRRHLDYYHDVAIAGERRLKGEGQEETLRSLEADHENILVAVRRSLESRKTAVKGLELACAMRRFWFLRGYYEIGREMLSRAREKAKPPARSALRARALVDEGILARKESLDDEAEKLLEEGLAVYRKVGDRHGIATALNALAILDVKRKEWSQATSRYREAMRLAEELEDRNLVAWMLNGLGDIAFRTNDIDAALERHREGLRIKESLGDERGQAMSLHKLGEIALAGGDRDTAATYLARALVIRRRLGYRAGIAATERLLARVDLLRGDLEGARSHLFEALRILDELGDRREIAGAMIDCAELAGRSGERARAGRYLGAAEALAEELRAKIEKELETAVASIGDDAELQNARRIGRASSWREAASAALAWVAPLPGRG